MHLLLLTLHCPSCFGHKVLCWTNLDLLVCFCCQAAVLQMVQGGVVAAFGLVRGSAQADMLQLSVGNPFTPQLLAQVRGFGHQAIAVLLSP